MIVIRISEVKMQRSNSRRTTKSNQRKVQSSTTLNRKYVKRASKQAEQPVATDMTQQIEMDNQMQTASMSGMTDTGTATVQQSPKITHFGSQMVEVAPMVQENEVAQPHPIQNSVNVRMKARAKNTKKPAVEKVSAKELKDQAIQKALASAETMNAEKSNKTKKSGVKVHFGFGKVMLALSCAAAAVFAIVYFVNLSMPDISLQVAAMQTGIDLSYPNYIPRDYSVSSITSEDNKVTMEFNNSTSGGSFNLTEEKSSWDTNALLSNFVKEEYGENYTIVREQGLTIYISGSDAAWVNGGIVYKIKTLSGTLTNKQIRSIAVSL